MTLKVLSVYLTSLLEFSPISHLHPLPQGSRCLELAVLGGQRAVVGALCGAGADMNVRDADGLPPLWHALAKDREDIASVLVSDLGHAFG